MSSRTWNRPSSELDSPLLFRGSPHDAVYDCDQGIEALLRVSLRFCQTRLFFCQTRLFFCQPSLLFGNGQDNSANLVLKVIDVLG